MSLLSGMGMRKWNCEFFPSGMGMEKCSFIKWNGNEAVKSII